MINTLFDSIHNFLEKEDSKLPDEVEEIYKNHIKNKQYDDPQECIKKVSKIGHEKGLSKQQIKQLQAICYKE